MIFAFLLIFNQQFSNSRHHRRVHRVLVRGGAHHAPVVPHAQEGWGILLPAGRQEEGRTARLPVQAGYGVLRLKGFRKIPTTTTSVCQREFQASGSRLLISFFNSILVIFRFLLSTANIFFSTMYFYSFAARHYYCHLNQWCILYLIWHLSGPTQKALVLSV